MRLRILAAIAVVFVVLVALVAYLHGHTVAVLQPRGQIADKERTLMLTATGLMLLVVIPVYVMTALIAFKYRESNPHAKYSPDFDHHRVAEIAWWAIPCAIIAVLAVITVKSSNELDPFRPIDSTKAPVTIEVVALDWKWLFIYPKDRIASVNLAEFPAGTPVHFIITSDAPMNSFWIPQLGGQIYAMAGMTTQLNLVAAQNGDYQGVSANISGAGFAGMKFIARATTPQAYDAWIQQAQQSAPKLDWDSYQALAKPSQNDRQRQFQLADQNLYNQVVMKYMASPAPTQP